MAMNEKRELLASHLGLPINNVNIQGDSYSCNGRVYFVGRESDLFKKLKELVGNNAYMYFRRKNNIVVMLKEGVISLEEILGDDYYDIVNKNNVHEVIGLLKQENISKRDILEGMVNKSSINLGNFSDSTHFIDEIKESVSSIFDDTLAEATQLLGESEDEYSNQKIKKFEKYVKENREMISDEGLMLIIKKFSGDNWAYNDLEFEDIAEALIGLGPEHNNLIFELAGDLDSFTRKLVDSGYKNGGISSFLDISGSEAHYEEGFYICETTGLFH